ncbi:MAG: 3'(2'),5'-bisphosphate nucleotidase CysQ [Solirubrobacteraceae bacterium]
MCSRQVHGDAALAAELAQRAGALLVELRGSGRAAGRELGALGDRLANELIVAELRRRRPSDAVLSEESADDLARLRAERVWIVDPLDGTREFTMPGRRDWAVHVACWARAGGLIAGAVAEPAGGAVWRSDRSGPRVQFGGPLSVVVSASRPPPWIDPMAARLGARVTTMGSAGAKAMSVLRGEHAAYVHDGGQWEWDSAAPVAVALAHGLHASRVDGSPLSYNRPDPYLPDLLICHRDRAPELLAAIAEARPAQPGPDGA